jgi:hypothetical protein
VGSRSDAVVVADAVFDADSVAVVVTESVTEADAVGRRGGRGHRG